MVVPSHQHGTIQKTKEKSWCLVSHIEVVFSLAQINSQCTSLCFLKSLGNVALKINTKLSSPSNRGSAWQVQHATELGENLNTIFKETLVIGYTMTPQPGQLSKMVVSACCLIDGKNLRFGHTFRLQSKQSLVSSKIMKDILQVVHFWDSCNLIRVRGLRSE